MNDEIKEIDNSDLMDLLETTSKKDFYRLTLDHELVVRLYNWITNLQKENEELKEEIQRQSKALCINDKLLVDYRDRIDKAIEYLKEHTDKVSTIRVPKLDFSYNELLKILGGDE